MIAGKHTLTQTHKRQKYSNYYQQSLGTTTGVKIKTKVGGGGERVHMQRVWVYAYVGSLHRGISLIDIIRHRIQSKILSKEKTQIKKQKTKTSLCVTIIKCNTINARMKGVKFSFLLSVS